MKFPDYVPATVREYLALQLDPHDPDSWAAARDRARADLARLERKLESARPIDEGAADELRRSVAARRAHLAGLDRNVKCLETLGRDAGMKKAYSLLCDEFDAPCVRDFIATAFEASGDFSAFRDQAAVARDLSEEIASRAEELAKMLRKAGSVGLSTWPDVFFSIPALLSATEHQQADRNRRLWRGRREWLLGRSQKREDARPPEPREAPLRVRRVPVAPGEASPPSLEDSRRDAAIYAWSTAPEVPAMIDAIARAAHACKPDHGGFVDAAVGRENKPRTGYVRAFGHQWGRLVERRGFPALTPKPMHALAIIATVVLDDPNPMTYDHVRKLLRPPAVKPTQTGQVTKPARRR